MAGKQLLDCLLRAESGRECRWENLGVGGGQSSQKSRRPLPANCLTWRGESIVARSHLFTFRFRTYFRRSHIFSGAG